MRLLVTNRGRRGRRQVIMALRVATHVLQWSIQRQRRRPDKSCKVGRSPDWSLQLDP